MSDHWWKVEINGILYAQVASLPSQAMMIAMMRWEQTHSRDHNIYHVRCEKVDTKQLKDTGGLTPRQYIENGKLIRQFDPR